MHTEDYILTHLKWSRRDIPDGELADAVNAQARLMAGIHPDEYWEEYPRHPVADTHPYTHFQQHSPPLTRSSTDQQASGNTGGRRSSVEKLIVFSGSCGGVIFYIIRRFTMTSQTTVTRTLVPEDQRLAITEKLFGVHFPTAIGAGHLHHHRADGQGLHGGYWEFYTLSNGGFYMAPSERSHLSRDMPEQFEGDLSADALGITACLYAYSNLVFHRRRTFARDMHDHYHWLREYMMEHPEVGDDSGGDRLN